MSHTIFSAPPPATGSTGQTAEQQKLFLILLFVSFMAGKSIKIYLKRSKVYISQDLVTLPGGSMA